MSDTSIVHILPIAEKKNVGKLLHKCFQKEQRFLMLSQNHSEGKSFPLLPAPFFYCSLSMLKRNRETCHAKCALLTPRRVRQLKRPCLEHMLIGEYWRLCSPSFPLCHSKTKSCLRTRVLDKIHHAWPCTSRWPWVAQADFQPCWNQGIEAMGIMRLAQSYAASISRFRLGF